MGVVAGAHERLVDSLERLLVCDLSALTGETIAEKDGSRRKLEGLGGAFRGHGAAEEVRTDAETRLRRLAST